MDEFNPKPARESLTIWAAVGIIIVTLLNLLGAEISSDEAPAIGEAVGGIVTCVLSVLAIYGRYRAARKIR